jgi:hypothetical protein
MTLLQETIFDIEKSKHTTADIVFIGSETTGHSCTWDEFCQLSNKDYDRGFGAQRVATDLIIVFSDGAKMWRGEYDGSEWWEYSTPFKQPAETKPIKKLMPGTWDSLARMNGEPE